jgi:LytS/YehU family sensor histidine kinase
MTFLIACLLFTVPFILIFLIWKSKKNQQLINEENRRIKEQIKLLENEQLKFQLQPHTVKNILSNLRLFAKKLNQGMDTLSDTLDYVLYKGQQNFVSVEEEINFMRQYIKLNDLFIPGIDCITFNDTNVDRNSFYFSNMCIPHLITAYFIENAFKHGDTAHRDFLTIDVSLNDEAFHLEVTNKVQSYALSTERKGIGLSNMRKRLELLTGDQFKVYFGQTEDEYRSELTIYFHKDGLETSNS